MSAQDDDDDGFPYSKQRNKKLGRIQGLIVETGVASDWETRDECLTAVAALLDDYAEVVGSSLARLAEENTSLRARHDRLEHDKVDEMNVLNFWRKLSVTRQRRLIASLQVAAPDAFEPKPVSD